MNDITPEEAIEILSHYTDLGYGIVIEGDDVSKIVQALSLARKTLANGIPYEAPPKNDWIPIKSAEELPKDRMLWVTDIYGRVSELHYDMTEWSGYVRVDEVVAYKYKDKDPEAYDGPVYEP